MRVLACPSSLETTRSDMQVGHELAMSSGFRRARRPGLAVAGGLGSSGFECRRKLLADHGPQRLDVGGVQAHQNGRSLSAGSGSSS